MSTEEAVVTPEAQPDVLNMSDADFAALDFNSMDTSPVTDVQESLSEPAEEQLESEEGNQADEDLEEATEPSEELTEDTEEEVVETSEEIDYKSEYQKLLAPFKANGKEIQVQSIDDAITLMQMGANYNKKMAGLKPNLKLIKMLDKNGLLDENKLSFLIDLDKKNPDAIKKYLKESGVDPLDLLDVDTPTEYTPNTYTVNDKEIELDGILDEIKDTDSFGTTVDIISNKWDDSSKRVLVENPDVIKIINSHVESGVYQQITTVIESERMLGRLSGLSDIEAYKQVGQMLSQVGKLGTPSPATNTPVTKQQPSKNTVDPLLRDRKKAVSSTKSTPAPKADMSFNPLSMSDEEFAKISNKYL